MESIAVLRSNKASKYQSQEVNCSARDLEVLCSKGIKPESTDDNGRELHLRQCFREMNDE